MNLHRQHRLEMTSPNKSRFGQHNITCQPVFKGSLVKPESVCQTVLDFAEQQMVKEPRR